MQEGPAHNRVADAFDKISIVSGRITSWLTFFMVVVTVIVVVMRYVFDAGAVWLQESVVWMHAVVFMVGAAYTLQQDEHVRVDVFYRAMSKRRRAWIDLTGVVFFLWPLCAFLAMTSFDFIVASFGLREASRASGGLPYPFYPVLKTALLIMPLTVALQGLSLFLKALAMLRGR